MLCKKHVVACCANFAQNHVRVRVVSMQRVMNSTGNVQVKLKLKEKVSSARLHNNIFGTVCCLIGPNARTMSWCYRTSTYKWSYQQAWFWRKNTCPAGACTHLKCFLYNSLIDGIPRNEKIPKSSNADKFCFPDALALMQHTSDGSQNNIYLRTPLWAIKKLWGWNYLRRKNI